MTTKNRRQELMDQAAAIAVSNRHRGFHCSECVFLAVNEIFQITDPSMVRLITGFHGGGGSRRKHANVDLTKELNEAASGRFTGPIEEFPVEITGHLCGALAAGIALFGLLYGRQRPEDDLTCVDELSFEYHQRFQRQFETKLCSEIREKWVPLSENKTCEFIYARASSMIVELLLESGDLIDRCPGCLPPEVRV